MNITLIGRGPYEPLCDPSGEWIVWDAVKDTVAESNGNVLFGLSHGDALRFSVLMNRAWRLPQSLDLQPDSWRLDMAW